MTARAYAASSALAGIGAESNRNSSASSGSAVRSATASHGGVSDGDGTARAPAAATRLRARTVRRLCAPCMAKNVTAVAEVVRVRRHHGGRRVDLQVVVQALLMRQHTRAQAREVMRHRHRLAVVVLGRVHDLVVHRPGLS